MHGHVSLSRMEIDDGVRRAVAGHAIYQEQQRSVMEPSILIIDADPQAAHITGAVIAQLAPNARLTITSSTLDGLSLMQQRWPDLLFIDPSPHQSSAFKMIQQAKTVRPSTRVVAIASIPTPALRRRMQELGVDLYCEKPLLLPLCMNELRALLQPSTTPAPVTV